MTQAAILAASGSPGTTTGFKNRIINGGMVIDQRNAGSAITPTAGQYSLDRWNCQLSQSGKYTIGQYSTAPTGFSNSIGVSSNSSYSVGASDYFFIQQVIEGYNIADLNWGTANAKTITLSFWVRSSLTGTFGGCLENSGASYNYPFTYTISAANTWEQKSVTIAGPTSGTWLTTNGAGIFVIFGLGVGSSYSFAPGSWTSSVALGATGATSVVGTSGASWYVTGVQFEVGTTATNFDFRDFGRELMLCQRYYESTADTGTVITSMGSTYRSCTTVYAGSNYFGPVVFKVQKRAIPTITFYYSSSSGSLSGYTTGGASTVTANSQNESQTGCNGVISSVTNLSFVQGNWVASAEL